MVEGENQNTDFKSHSLKNSQSIKRSKLQNVIDDSNGEDSKESSVVLPNFEVGRAEEAKVQEKKSSEASAQRRRQLNFNASGNKRAQTFTVKTDMVIQEKPSDQCELQTPPMNPK